MNYSQHDGGKHIMTIHCNVHTKASKALLDSEGNRMGRLVVRRTTVPNMYDATLYLKFDIDAEMAKVLDNLFGSCRFSGRLVEFVFTTDEPIRKLENFTGVMAKRIVRHYSRVVRQKIKKTAAAIRFLNAVERNGLANYSFAAAVEALRHVMYVIEVEPTTYHLGLIQAVLDSVCPEEVAEFGRKLKMVMSN